MRLASVILLFLLTGSEANKPQERSRKTAVSTGNSSIKLKPQYDLEHRSLPGRCTISVRQSDGTRRTRLKALRGERLIVDVRFQTTASGYFYNLFFDSWIPFPGHLTIFDSDGRYLYALPAWCHLSSSRSPVKDDWHFISNGYVGTFRQIVAGRLPCGDSGGESNDLPPGKYYIQMIYRERFVLPKGSHPASVQKAFDELFRSNVIELEVLEGQEKVKRADEDSVDRSCSCGPEDFAAPDRLRVEKKRQYDLEKGPLRGRCTLLFRHNKFRGYNLVTAPRGQKLDIDIRFEPTADGDFYNPLFNDQIPLPGHLTIFHRERGEYLGILTDWCNLRPSREPRESDWHRLSDGYVGTTRSIVAGHIPCGHFLGQPHDLPPGRYLIQMVFRDRFVLPRTSDPAKVREASAELFRSNSIELVLVEDRETLPSDTKSKMTLELKYDLSAGSTAGRCVLSFQRDEHTGCKRLEATRGEEVVLDIRFKPRGPEEFYNPFFDPSFPLPGCVAVFNWEGQYLGDLIPPSKLDVARPLAENAWSSVGSNYVGTTRRLKAGHLPFTQDTGKPSSLPSGTYYIQVIVYKRFVLPRKRTIADLLEATQEVCRSNIVELRIVDDEEKGMSQETAVPGKAGETRAR